MIISKDDYNRKRNFVAILETYRTKIPKESYYHIIDLVSCGNFEKAKQIADRFIGEKEH